MGTDKLNVDCLITVRINLGMGNARSLLVRLFLCRWIVILFSSLKTQHSPFFLPFVLNTGIYEIGLLHQRSSNFSKHWLPGRAGWNPDCWASPWSADSAGLRWGWRTCTVNESPVLLLRLVMDYTEPRTAIPTGRPWAGCPIAAVAQINWGLYSDLQDKICDIC